MYRSREFIRVYLMQVFYLFAIVFSWSFVYMHLMRAGFSFADMFLFKLASYSSAVVLMLFLKQIDTMKSIGIGSIAFALELAAIPFIHGTSSLVLLGLFDGLTFPLFWIPYNNLYFSLGKRQESAYLAGLTFLLPPIFCIILPFASGLIIDSYGTGIVLLIGAAVLLVSGIYFGIQKGGVMNMDFRRSVSAGKGLKALLFIQGFWHGVDWICAPLFTLYFFTSGVSYGGFISFVAVFGAFSTLYFCSVSDRTGNRVNYLYPSIVMTAAATVMSAFASNMVNWLIVRAIVGFFVAVSNPFTISIVLDRMKDTSEAIYLREVMLNVGRTAGIVVVVLCTMFFGGFQNAFIASGVLLLAYPLLVERKGLYRVKARADSIMMDEHLESHD
ncbi:MAG: hypothetical protein V1744_04805 [Candidatus Altiarchaeota archaeon]